MKVKELQERLALADPDDDVAVDLSDWLEGEIYPFNIEWADVSGCHVTLTV